MVFASFEEVTWEERTRINKIIFFIEIHDEIHVTKLLAASSMKWEDCSGKKCCPRIPKKSNQRLVVQSLGKH